MILDLFAATRCMCRRAIRLGETMIEGAVKDKQSITPDWTPIKDEIDGVIFREVKNVLTRNGGVTTEAFRDDWSVGPTVLKHVIYVTLQAGAISAWHCHEFQSDCIFVVRGQLKAVLYDGRDGSPTHGRISVHQLGPLRPGLLVVPPGVWHGLQCLSDEPAGFLNMFDRAYVYTDPDEWRLPADTTKIPYKF